MAACAVRLIRMLESPVHPGMMASGAIIAIMPRGRSVAAKTGAAIRMAITGVPIQGAVAK